MSTAAATAGGIGRIQVGDVTRSDRTAEDIQGAPISLVFTLPNGTKVEKKGGENMTVAYLKTQIAAEHKIEYDHQDLYYGGKLMADPYSLSDFEFDVTKPVAIEVRLSEEASSATGSATSHASGTATDGKEEDDDDNDEYDDE